MTWQPSTPKRLQPMKDVDRSRNPAYSNRVQRSATTYTANRVFQVSTITYRAARILVNGNRLDYCSHSPTFVQPYSCISGTFSHDSVSRLDWLGKMLGMNWVLAPDVQDKVRGTHIQRIASAP
ncbi:hypothetical protein PV10_01665 [Exophiala mesophila]|uniref:Uncharacterized protein n=1 Tax=Exophiala mesophila TaxID=212818 RepID=A0A0D1X7W6_EXOME|nr:uncharacterized protein PV10_01665 [Exophiala mesophila]KIV97970.1 hypothetical protein PV10_01665 [Exophiala mesophila]